MLPFMDGLPWAEAGKELSTEKNLIDVSFLAHFWKSRLAADSTRFPYWG